MSIAVTTLATLALLVIFWNRGAGFEKIPTLVYASMAYGVAWLGAAVVLWQVAGGPWPRLAAFHILAGAVGIAGIIGVVDWRDSITDCRGRDCFLVEDWPADKCDSTSATDACV